MFAEPRRLPTVLISGGELYCSQRLSMDLSFVKIAKRLNIAVSTAHKVYTYFEQSGNVDPQFSKSRPEMRKLDEYLELYIFYPVRMRMGYK